MGLRKTEKFTLSCLVLKWLERYKNNIPMKDRIVSYINKNKKWLLNKLLDLISIDTTNIPPYGNENNGQEFIEQLMKTLGLNIDRFTPEEVSTLVESEVYLKGRSYKNRDNLVGTIGAGMRKTVIFNGHIDTVPSQDLRWRICKPFEPKVIDNRVYGLGSCDMKGGLMASIYALKAIVDLNIPIMGKIIIESVVDEEFGGGNGSLACVKKGYIGDFAIIAEPTNIDICVSNVSSIALDVEVLGVGGLGYLEKKEIKGENPIVIAARLINALKVYEEYLNCSKYKYDIYRGICKPIRFLFSDIVAGRVDPSVPFRNPENCYLRIYLMNYPDICRDEFMNMLFSFLEKFTELSENIRNGSITIRPAQTIGGYHRFIEGGSFDLSIDTNKKFIADIIDNGKKLTGRELRISAMLGGTDFFAFSNYGYTPVIVLGPGGGNCHGADEYVNFQDLVDLAKIYAGVIYDYCCS